MKAKEKQDLCVCCVAAHPLCGDFAGEN